MWLKPHGPPIASHHRMRLKPHAPYIGRGSRYIGTGSPLANPYSFFAKPLALGLICIGLKPNAMKIGPGDATCSPLFRQSRSDDRFLQRVVLTTCWFMREIISVLQIYMLHQIPPHVSAGFQGIHL